ncbi:MAG: hypothetical protein F9K24_10815 [Leptonema illini]|uniref:Prepilin-type N-terminal cleavage/methylation domain-containing protein n=1 Tax=Leptonema illini TaxID=183 RepID=A0A833LX13_9LEPT|nr:MAG: hypothetical protein F9K24_10815 [Leptonema illini]
MRLHRVRLRSGVTLVEMALAMSVAATFCMMTLYMIADGMRLRQKSEKMALASTLAQAKMAQLLSRPFLDVTGGEGEDGDMGDSGPYAHFKYTIKITEEQIDLAAVSSEGKISVVNVDDRLDAGVQNGKPRERAGQGAATETGGLVDINRIILIIDYPVGSEREQLRIETFKAAAKTTKP